MHSLMSDGADASPSRTPKADSIIGVRVYWKIRLMDPDFKNGTPQIIAVVSPDGCISSPDGSINSHYAIVELNHSTLPEHYEGGVQLQVWNHDLVSAWQAATRSGVTCKSASESIEFIIEMRLEENAESATGRMLWFNFIELKSTTWGTHRCIASHGVETALTSLDGFTPQTSITESGINVGGNRVDCMAIDRIDYFYKSGASSSDSTDYVIHKAKMQVDTELTSKEVLAVSAKQR
jgi:hypothetical protein